MKREEIIERLIKLKFPIKELRQILTKLNTEEHLKSEAVQAGAILCNACINFNKYVNQEIARHE